MTPPTSNFDAVCYIRPPVTGPTERIVETLRSHDRAGRLNSLRVELWPATISLGSTVTTDITETVTQFREWADTRDATLAPAFSVDEHVSQITGEREMRLRLPVVCLAVYQDDSLYCVIPHQTDERTCTVQKALGVLESEEPAPQTTFANAVHP